jgi:hypothetical protein
VEAVAPVLDCPFLHLYNRVVVNPHIMTATPFLTHAPSLELDTVDFTLEVALRPTSTVALCPTTVVVPTMVNPCIYRPVYEVVAVAVVPAGEVTDLPRRIVPLSRNGERVRASGSQ